MAQQTRTAVAAAAVTAVSRNDSAGINIHRFDQRSPFRVNAFVVEDADGLVAIDATLTESASKAFRAKIDEFAKPLRAVLLTHPHPDHYAGLGNLVAGLDVPIFSVAGVNEVVRREDAAKNEVIGGMFGTEWPRHRVFPNTTVKDGDVVTLCVSKCATSARPSRITTACSFCRGRRSTSLRATSRTG